MSTQWLALLGRFEEEPDAIVFKGGTTTLQDGQPGFEVANFVSDQYFGGGRIRADIRFRGRHERSAAGLILFYQPQSASFVQAQLGGFALCSVQTWAGQRWNTHGAAGPPNQLQPDVTYAFEALVTGSRVMVFLNGVQALEVNLPFSLPRGQAGLWALGPTDIAFSGFSVIAETPKLFVIMQLSPPFDDLFEDVITPVGKKAGFEVIRADQIAGPGVIIADIERQIIEAKAVVAEITPANPNVFWEVGYAHAIRKPTVLIAQSDTKLPFDVSPFRILLYDNTIGGKAKIEEGLRKHLAVIQTQWAVG
ncbi:MAG: hypothetical protein C3F12_14375 [Candidatus Methylomirabilota bacterium]|nr:hypothetical protein [candidate division NC10 bacterium]PWB42389.1 MAG: hypothetical protein C3F12_14375 [candidate division NC10 bacterium]